MKITNTITCGITVVLFYMIVDTECFQPMTALEMIHQKLCVCPCGNPKGGKLYTIPSKRLNWFEAVAYCELIGMSIATIKDANDRRLLQLYLQQNRYNLRSLAGREWPLWIGANNLAAEGGFRWGLSNQEAKTSEWNTASSQRNEPSCVYIQGETMRWVPAPCDNEERQFVCEY